MCSCIGLVVVGVRCQEPLDQLSIELGLLRVDAAVQRVCRARVVLGLDVPAMHQRERETPVRQRQEAGESCPGVRQEIAELR